MDLHPPLLRPLDKPDAAAPLASMFLKTRQDGSLMEVLTLPQLFDPFSSHLQGRLHAGEELQEPELFLKTDLIFPSGEPLPLCWLDPHYPQP